MNIIFYSKTGCPWCNEVRDLLVEKGVEFEERDVIKNPDFYSELLNKSGQDKAPTLDIDGDIIPDTDAQEVSEYLKKKGVPGF